MICRISITLPKKSRTWVTFDTPTHTNANDVYPPMSTNNIVYTRGFCIELRAIFNIGVVFNFRPNDYFPLRFVISLSCMSALCLLDRSMMIGWRTNSWKYERASSLFTFVSLCLSLNEVQSTSFHMWTIKIFIFTLFIDIFRFVSLYNNTWTDPWWLVEGIIPDTLKGCIHFRVCMCVCPKPGYKAHLLI